MSADLSASEEEALTDHILIYGDPSVKPSEWNRKLLEALGPGALPRPTRTLCSWGKDCPIHPDGMGGPWV